VVGLSSQHANRQVIKNVDFSTFSAARSRYRRLTGAGRTEFAMSRVRPLMGWPQDLPATPCSRPRARPLLERQPRHRRRLAYVSTEDRTATRPLASRHVRKNITLANLALSTAGGVHMIRYQGVAGGEAINRGPHTSPQLRCL